MHKKYNIFLWRKILLIMELSAVALELIRRQIKIIDSAFPIKSGPNICVLLRQVEKVDSEQGFRFWQFFSFNNQPWFEPHSKANGRYMVSINRSMIQNGYCDDKWKNTTHLNSIPMDKTNQMEEKTVYWDLNKIIFDNFFLTFLSRTVCRYTLQKYFNRDAA